VADKSSQLMLDALRRAVADPGGLPLHAGKKTPGLFAATAAGKQAAQRCQDEGYLRVLHLDANGKSAQAYFAASEKGLAYLLDQVSPRQVLEDLVRTLEARQTQVGELVAAARRWQSGLDALQAVVRSVLLEIQKPGGATAGTGPSANGSEIWLAEVVACLNDWHAAGKSSDYPLPDLYRKAQHLAPDVTIGRFHDGLRRLHEQQRIYLHPWTGPLYEMPEAAYALLIGHEIVYYASIR
jgi:hypothetical protein